MTAYRVTIPEESYSVLEFQQKELPGIAVVNSALCDFEPKVVFGWHLSLLIEFEDLVGNGMPSQEEREVIDAFGDKLDDLIKGSDPEKPNAMFLARITWNETRELIWLVFEPEPVHKLLQRIIDEDSAPRPFDYRMEHDPEWEKAEWHLSNVRDARE